MKWQSDVGLAEGSGAGGGVAMACAVMISLACGACDGRSSKPAQDGPLAVDFAPPRDLPLPTADLGLDRGIPLDLRSIDQAPTPDSALPSDGSAGSDGGLLQACQLSTSDNVLYVESSPGDPIGLGQTQLITGGQWLLSSSFSPVWLLDTIRFTFIGNGWTFGIGSSKLSAGLATGTYANAERLPFESAGHPGISVGSKSTNSTGCSKVCGGFTIHTLETDPAGTEPLELLVTFEQHCDCQPAPLRGCLRWRRP